MSSLSSMSDKEGQTLLAGLFGSSIGRDCRGLLSLIRSQIRVSSFGRLDGEVVENCQSPLRSCIRIWIIRTSSIGLILLMQQSFTGMDATLDGLECLKYLERIKFIAELITRSRLPIIHICALKILLHAVRIGEDCRESLTVLHIFLAVYVCVDILANGSLFVPLTNNAKY